MVRAEGQDGGWRMRRSWSGERGERSQSCGHRAKKNRNLEARIPAAKGVIARHRERTQKPGKRKRSSVHAHRRTCSLITTTCSSISMMQLASRKVPRPNDQRLANPCEAIKHLSPRFVHPFAQNIHIHSRIFMNCLRQLGNLGSICHRCSSALRY